jgi:prepilin-type N-terminal cleavage/methylation domain-containing protein
MKPSSVNHSKGFTLIEMMAVIAIIAILGAITVGGLSFVNDRKAKAKAQIDIGLLSQAIEKYKLDMGEYPGDDDTPVEGKVSEQLYQALFLDGYNSQNGGDGSISIFLAELDPCDGRHSWVEHTSQPTPNTTAKLKIMDPWFREYRYRKGANAQNPDFDLWTCGKDGKTDANNPLMTVQENKDDIRNF